MAQYGSDHWASFGDGNAAQVVDFKEYIKKDTGVRYIRFIFIPSQLIERTYDISSKQDPETRALVMEYPATDVIFLQRGTGRSRCWVLTDFMGGATVMSRRDQDVREALRDTEGCSGAPKQLKIVLIRN